MADISEEFAQGFRTGYAVGDGERIALATANSELRTELRELQTMLKKLMTEQFNQQPIA